MCLTVNKTKKQRSYKINDILEDILDKYSKVSNKDKVVYKVLLVRTNNNNKLYTPFQNTEIDKDGDMLIADELSFYDGYTQLDIHKGIHAYNNLEKAKDMLSGFTIRIIVKCIIPAGTPYIIGTRKDIVSFMLFIPPLKVKFNKEGRLRKKYYE